MSYRQDRESTLGVTALDAGTAHAAARIALLSRGIRFSFVGTACTFLAYAIFVSLIRLSVPYMAANVVAWAMCVLLSFVLNRSVTFGIRGRGGAPAQFGKFVVGSVVQLALASFGYWLLIGVFRLGPTVSFVINLALTSGFMFIYLNVVAFRR